MKSVGESNVITLRGEIPSNLAARCSSHIMSSNTVVAVSLFSLIIPFRHYLPYNELVGALNVEPPSLLDSFPDIVLDTE